MTLVKGFFFDLDGTLVDTHHSNYEAYKKALAEKGVSITFEDFKKTIGMQAQDFLPMLAPNMSKDAYEEIAASKAIHYRELLHLTKLNLELVKFIDYMSKNYTLAIVTTAKKANAESVLEHHGLTKYFDIVITANDVTKSKPSPEAYELALSRSKLSADEVIAFEDSDSGVKAAELAGISVVRIEDFQP